MAKLTVLGIGSTIMRDEGIGVRVLERVRDSRQWPEDVEFIDGGAGGLGLLNVIEEARRLAVFDAADMGLAPGEWREISPAQIRDEQDDGRLSLHEAPFIETLKLCEQFLSAPGDVRILAIQPKEVEYGLEMSPELAAAVDELARAGAELVEEMLKND